MTPIIRSKSVLFALIVLALIIYFNKVNQQFQQPDEEDIRRASDREMITSKPKSKPKRILFYTAWFGDKPWPIAPPTMIRKCKCPFNCTITYDQNDLKRSDLVVFHGRDMPHLNVTKQISGKKPRDQLWMYYVKENPYNTPNVEPIAPYFDLTSTYRTDSDVRAYYAIPVRVNRPDLTRNYADGKTGQIAWAVSNCGHRRDRLAEKLIRFGLKIDNFGKCNLTYLNSRYVPKSKNPPYEKYKFIFAAENRLCRDYVTEKYWRWGLTDDVNSIPIVLGGADYSSIAIPGSYIDALTFPSPKALADYLIQVDQNDTLFNEYFKWKRHWKSEWGGCTWMCEMCEKIHRNSWERRKDPLLDMTVMKDCRPKERFFDKWILGK